MKKIPLFFLILAAAVACNSGNAKKQASSSQQDETAIEKCFTLEGVKYETTIRFTIQPDGTVTGTVSSAEYFSEMPDEASFTGTKAGDNLTIKFSADAPTVGDKSAWTDKDWRLGEIDGVETLFITFNAQNFETMEWEDTEYEFAACSVHTNPVED